MKSLPMVRLGKSLRDMRKHRGLTQEQVAALAGVPRLKVIQIEKGDSKVSVDAYAQVARAVGGELSVTPARRPTLEEAREYFSNDGD
jgi:transcriptional regulator with XRE-family HTH domain